jgi:hypothetical protein
MTNGDTVAKAALAIRRWPWARLTPVAGDLIPLARVLLWGRDALLLPNL